MHFVPDMLTMFIGKNTESETIAAADAPRRVKPPSEWRPAPLLAVCWRLFFGVSVRGHLLQMGGIDAPFESWETVEQNPFFSANAKAAKKWPHTLTNCGVWAILAGRFCELSLKAHLLVGGSGF